MEVAACRVVLGLQPEANDASENSSEEGPDSESEAQQKEQSVMKPSSDVEHGSAASSEAHASADRRSFEHAQGESSDDEEAHMRHAHTASHTSDSCGSGSCSGESGLTARSSFEHVPNPTVATRESLNALMDARLDAYMRSPAVREFAAGAAAAVVDGLRRA